jgi:cell division protein FtsQ
MSTAAKSSLSKIKRGATPVRKPRPLVKKRRSSKPKGPTWLDKILIAMRITPELIRKATTLLILGLGAALTIAAATYAGIPRMIANSFAAQVANAGFVVKRVEITGLEHMDRMTVYGIALDQHTMSMASVDLTGVRQKLLGYGWIADAHVTRRLPDTLVVEIEERKPAAVWQHSGKLALVDGHGIVLEPLTAENMPTDLPLVIGPDANKQSSAMATLLSHAPRLKPLIAGATWVGNRRWDLRFQTGETLALPEGVAAAAAALSAFSRKDRQHPLLGKGYARFDTRDGEHIYVKLKREEPTTQASVESQHVDAPTAGTKVG